MPHPHLQGHLLHRQRTNAAAAPTTESAPEGGFMYTGDIDNVWSHGIHQGQQGFKCLYCGREYCGGGATRLTEHLAWVGKNIRHCDRVPPEVRAAMRKSRLDKLEYKREEDERRLRIERELVQEARGNHVIDVDAVDMQTQIAISRLMKELDLRREVDRNAGRNSGSSTASHCGKSGPIEKYLRRKNTADKSTVVSEGYQERIDVAFDKTKVARIGEAWARFFHANAIPGRKADCPYFRAALLLSMELGVVHPLPKGSDIDGKYLTANRMELEEYVMQFNRMEVLCTGVWSYSLLEDGV